MNIVQMLKPLDCAHFIKGEWIGAGKNTQPVVSPYYGEAIGTVPIATKELVQQTVATAKAASNSWRTTPIKERVQVLDRFRLLVLANIDAIAQTVALESGKTVDEGKAGILKGIEVCEFAISLANMESGGSVEVSRGVKCEYRREALGVVCGIAPFNFPAMVPMWMYPIAIALGNAFILKPSEKVPLTSQLMAKYMKEAGLPAGVFSILNGDKETVMDLISHPDVAAVGFVGSTPVAKKVYQTATALGKRALCLGGAKNYLIVMPDADEGVTVDGVVKSFTGCAGQRCMAASLMITVGSAKSIVGKIKDHAAKMKLGTDMGAIIDASSRERLQKAIGRAKDEGATLLLDGREATPPDSYKKGSWLAPTIISQARPDMDCAQSELFGPVLTVLEVETLEQAMDLENKSPFGNATSVFTNNGAAAQYVANRASNGMIGVNIGVPVPREPFSFGGTKESKFGQGDITGQGSLDLWSNMKKITTKWQQQFDNNWMS